MLNPDESRAFNAIARITTAQEFVSIFVSWRRAIAPPSCPLSRCRCIFWPRSREGCWPSDLMIEGRAVTGPPPSVFWKELPKKTLTLPASACHTAVALDVPAPLHSLP